MTITLAEKENQFQQQVVIIVDINMLRKQQLLKRTDVVWIQLEAKEAAWRAEWSGRLAEERSELERQLADERAARCKAAETAVSSMADERRIWQQQMDVLLEKTRYLLAEKERLEKNIRQEVDTQVQVQPNR